MYVCVRVVLETRKQMNADAIDPPPHVLMPLNGRQQTGIDVHAEQGSINLTNDNKSRSQVAAMETVCQYETRERFVITKNVIIIGLAFMIHFTAFHGTSNLQSSVNADKALGTTTLAVIYGSLILSNIFLPMTVIR